MMETASVVIPMKTLRPGILLNFTVIEKSRERKIAGRRQNIN
jgi:hypothetical protein